MNVTNLAHSNASIPAATDSHSELMYVRDDGTRLLETESGSFEIPLQRPVSRNRISKQRIAAADVLRAAWAKICHPSMMCHDTYARDADGNSCDPRSDRAVTYDIVGAVESLSGTVYTDVALGILQNFYGPPLVYCDSLKHYEVSSLFAVSIAHAERNQSR